MHFVQLAKSSLLPVLPFWPISPDDNVKVNLHVRLAQLNTLCHVFNQWLSMEFKTKLMSESNFSLSLLMLHLVLKAI